MTKIDAERIRAGKFFRTEARGDSRTSKTVDVRLIETHHKVGVARGFETYSDEPEEIGGRNAAPQPTEFMLLSLGFCQMSIIAYYAASMRIALDDIAITVTGHRDDRGIRGIGDARPGYHTIEMAVTLMSDEPPERLARLARVAADRCPVSDNLVNPTTIVSTVTHDDRTLWSSDAVALDSGTPRDGS